MQQSPVRLIIITGEAKIQPGPGNCKDI